MSHSTSSAPFIVRFYDADVQAKNSYGRSLEQILSWGDVELEQCHDYVQILFPLPESSMINREVRIRNRDLFQNYLEWLEIDQSFWDCKVLQAHESSSTPTSSNLDYSYHVGTSERL
jgi:hypothetical protein